MWPILRGFGAVSSPTLPDTPTLAVSDNANGTATATVSASTTGSTNVVYTRAITSSTWVSGGTRTGNGTVTLTLDRGVYDAYVKSTTSGGVATSTPVRFRVTSGVEAVWEQVLVGVHEKIVDLAISGISSSKIVIRKVPTTTDASLTSPKFPAIIVAPYRSETITPATNLREDIRYPVLVAIVAEDAVNQTSNRETYLKWREDIRRTLHYSQITITGTGAGACYDLRVSPMPVLSSDQWHKGAWVSTLVVEAYCREPRTPS